MKETLLAAGLSRFARFASCFWPAFLLQAPLMPHGSLRSILDRLGGLLAALLLFGRYALDAGVTLITRGWNSARVPRGWLDEMQRNAQQTGLAR